MTQAGLATLVAILSVTLLVAIVIILIGIIRYARLAHQFAQALSEIESTISQATRAIRSGFRTVKLEIKHSEELTSQKRNDIIQMILDSESRCTAMIRDLNLQLQMQGIRGQHPAVTNVVGDHAAIAQGEQVAQKRS